MLTHSAQQSVSPLRRRMLEDMSMRGLREDTQRDYIRFVQSFAAFLGRSPETATAEDIRRFQVDQAESGVQPPTINCSVSALRFFFTVTLDRPSCRAVRPGRAIPASCRQCSTSKRSGGCSRRRLGLKHKAALGAAYGARLSVSEVATLKVNTR